MEKILTFKNHNAEVMPIQELVIWSNIQMQLKRMFQGKFFMAGTDFLYLRTGMQIVTIQYRMETCSIFATS